MTLSLMNIDDIWDSTCNCGQFKEVIEMHSSVQYAESLIHTSTLCSII